MSADSINALKRELLDDDGENRAVRGLLSLIYGSGHNTVTTKQMRDHLSNLGFDECWPVWAAQDQALTKGGIQAWIRHLFNLEAATPATQPNYVRVPKEPTLAMCDAAEDEARHQGINIDDLNMLSVWAAMLEAAPTVPAQSDTQAEKDAGRWRALVNSARVRPLGCAGIRNPEESHYAHLGLELWTVFGKSLNDKQREQLVSENALGREWLTKYADIAISAQETTHG